MPREHNGVRRRRRMQTFMAHKCRVRLRFVSAVLNFEAEERHKKKWRSPRFCGHPAFNEVAKWAADPHGDPVLGDAGFFLFWFKEAASWDIEGHFPCPPPSGDSPGPKGPGSPPAWRTRWDGLGTSQGTVGTSSFGGGHVLPSLLPNFVPGTANTAHLRDMNTSSSTPCNSSPKSNLELSPQPRLKKKKKPKRSF